MQKYQQYCPVARASEILADRWTPLIVRELVLGSHRFKRDRARAARDLALAAVVTAPGPRRARIKRVPAGSPRRPRLTETRDTGAHPRSERRVGRRAQLTDEIIDVPRRGASGSRLRPVGGQAQMPQDAFRDARVLNQRGESSTSIQTSAASTRPTGSRGDAVFLRNHFLHSRPDARPRHPTIPSRPRRRGRTPRSTRRQQDHGVRRFAEAAEVTPNASDRR
jgi:hypothetical protein